MSTHNSDIPVKKSTKDIPYPMKVYQNATSSIVSTIAIATATLALFGWSGGWIDKTTLQIEHQFAVAEINRKMEDKQREHESEVDRLKNEASYRETWLQLKAVYSQRNDD